MPAGAIKELAKDVGRLREGFDRQVFELVRRAIARDESEAEVARRLERLGRAKQQHYYTLQNTIRLGIGRQGTIERSLESGVSFFRYVGPAAGARPFCRERVGKVYSIEEIRRMDNGQGLAVEYFCGGWNCRHRWVAFSGEVVGGVAVHDSWRSKYAKASKQERVVKDGERELAGRLAEYGKVELNAQRGEREGGDVDMYFEGRAAQVKIVKTDKTDAIRERLHKSKNQSDVFIFELEKDLIDEEEAFMKTKLWLNEHKEKEVYIYKKQTNMFKKL